MNTHVANVSRPAVSSRTSIAHDRIRIVASDKVDNKQCNLFRYETLHRQCARSTELHPMRLRFVHPATGSSRDLRSSRAGARCEPYTPSGPSAMPSRPCAPHARIGITNSISMRNIIYFNRDPTYDYLRPLRARQPYEEFSYTYCQNCVCCGCMKMLPHATPAVDCRPPRVELSQSATACRTMDDA